MLARVVVGLMIYRLASGAGGARAPRRPARDVATTSGAARGYLVSAPDPHYAFLGLPYARPPDRFKAPEPALHWDGIFEATHRIKCLQASSGSEWEGEENCLVVNVFVPEHAAACCRLPVLVHVHDGGFITGWGAYNPPSRFLRDFVIVTFNYRLGALGFLCLGTPDIPGNAGLKDQVAALYWVKTNIASFGGNSNDITLYGTGSGAASVQLLLLSGLTKGLIHRVILESGSVLSPSMMTYEPFSSAVNYAVSLGYEEEGNIEALEWFYREVALTDLLNTSTTFLPCVENTFYDSHNLIEQDPIHILNQGDFDKVPMIIVYTNAAEVSVIHENSDRFHLIPDNFEDLLPNNLEFNSYSMRHKVAEMIKYFYFKDIFDENVIQNYIDYFNDILVEYPTFKFAMLYASKSSLPVYVMKFSYSSDSESVEKGAIYGDVFKYINGKEDIENNDEVIIGKLVTLWNNFMKLGDPTPLTTSVIPVIWQPVNARNETDVGRPAYLIFSRTLRMNEEGRSQSLTFWDHVYGTFYKLHTFDSQDTE